MSYRLFTPRRFWNIAGRAGRPGFDHEGQVILFESSLGLERVNQPIEPYTQPALRDIPPVRSALAEGIRIIHEQVDSGLVNLDRLNHLELDDGIPATTQGVINLLRVGMAHSKAIGIDQSSDDYFDATYAARTLPESERSFARRLLRQQERILEEYLADPDSASVKLVAELGLSISTLSRLQSYVRGLEDWQFNNLARIIIGGHINLRQLPFVINPVLARMAELEGPRLSGIYSQVVIDWCSGKPFSDIRPLNNNSKLEDLIRLVYSRIQYLLPWGLYATDRFATEEASRRNVPYNGEVNQLAYLVDAGVPDWPALRLTSAGFERADAARLSRAYSRSPDARETSDVFAWVIAQSESRLTRIVQGSDRRRVDFDFFTLIESLREGQAGP